METKKCPYCGEEIHLNAKKCRFCGEWLNDSSNHNVPSPHTPASNPTISNMAPSTVPTEQRIIINQVEHRSNGVGTAGFVLAIISAFFSWVPGVGWAIWFIGLLLSFIGMFKSPRGLAITGFIISIFDLLLILVLSALIVGVIESIFG